MSDDQPKDKYQQVICWGVGCLKPGEPGYIEREDHSKPHPYYIVIEGSKAGLWYRREDFRYVYATISSREALHRIEQALSSADDVNALKLAISEILEQFHKGH